MEVRGVTENRCNFCHVNTHTYMPLNPALPIFYSPVPSPQTTLSVSPSLLFLFFFFVISRLPYISPQTPPRLTLQHLFLPYPCSSSADFNNSLSVAHWRHLAPSADTSPLCLDAGGPGGEVRRRGGSVTPLTLSPCCTKTWEIRAEKPSM